MFPVIALLPAWFTATALIWLVASIPFDPPFATFMVVAALGSVVMFVPLTQRLFVTRLLGVRAPDSVEQRRLAAASRIVVAAAGTPRRRFVFGVDETEDVSAFACGGHVLVVSSFAIANLDDDELVGVVAHEFGHHLGAHTIGLSFAQWFSLPVLVCERVALRLGELASRLGERLSRSGAGSPQVARGVVFVLTGFSRLFGSALTAAQRLNDIVGRDAEFHADKRAVELGFGRELRRALAHVASRDESVVGRSRLERIFSSHPPARTRIARIEALLRARRG